MAPIILKKSHNELHEAFSKFQEEVFKDLKFEFDTTDASGAEPINVD